MGIDCKCKACEKSFTVQDPPEVKEVICPICGQNVPVPRDVSCLSEQEEQSAKSIFCTHCGQKNNENNYKCTKCLAVLYRPNQARSAPSPGTDFASTIIPYKNVKALTAYYLGIFSIIPLLGVLLAIPAIIFGFLGLGQVKSQPHTKGKVHSWVGLIAAFVSICYHFIIILFIVRLGEKY